MSSHAFCNSPYSAFSLRAISHLTFIVQASTGSYSLDRVLREEYAEQTASSISELINISHRQCLRYSICCMILSSHLEHWGRLSSFYVNKMDLSLPLIVTLIAIATTFVWGTARYFDISRAHSPLEPPIFASKVPFIGHIIGLLIHGLKYYQITRYY